MALRRACPVQRSHAADLDARTRSVSPRPCPGAPPLCPTQELSRTPQTRPINDRPPTQTCWSAACAYAKRRRKRLYLVAGVHDHRATSGLGPDEPAGQGAAAYSRPGGCPTQCRSGAAESRETPRRGRTFGYMTRVAYCRARQWRRRGCWRGRVRGGRRSRRSGPGCAGSGGDARPNTRPDAAGRPKVVAGSRPVRSSPTTVSRPARRARRSPWQRTSPATAGRSNPARRSAW
jgi:hypothetical protein